MKQYIDKVDKPVLDSGSPAEETRRRRSTPSATKSLRRRSAMVIFAAAAIAYVAYKLPPYLTFDPKNSQVTLQYPLHFALLSAHVICGSIALLTTVLQVWPWLRRKHPAVHRISGRLYVFAGALPSAALALSMYPVTPGAGRVAIVAAATLWSTTAVLGWMTARRRRFAEHRRWMVYSFAIMWGYGVWVFVYENILYGIGFSVSTSVEAARWIGWTSNLLIAHWWLERTAGRTIIGMPRRPAGPQQDAGTESPSAPTNTAP